MVNNVPISRRNYKKVIITQVDLELVEK